MNLEQQNRVRQLMPHQLDRTFFLIDEQYVVPLMDALELIAPPKYATISSNPRELLEFKMAIQARDLETQFFSCLLYDKNKNLLLDEAITLRFGTELEAFADEQNTKMSYLSEEMELTRLNKRRIREAFQAFDRLYRYGW